MTTEPLWTGARLIEAMGARSQGPAPAAVTGASIDTRTLEPGDAFFAITGEDFGLHPYRRPQDCEPAIKAAETWWQTRRGGR